MSSAHNSVRSIDRRTFLSRIAMFWSVASVSLFAACSPLEAWLEVRLQASLRELALDPQGARLIAAAGEMTPKTAGRSFRGDLSSRQLFELTSTKRTLRRFIEAQSRADLRTGRAIRVHGWWVAETELAVAVLSVQ